MKTPEWKTWLGVALCQQLSSFVLGQTIETDTDDDGEWDWKPLVITLGVVAITLLVIITIIIVVRCCNCCIQDDPERHWLTTQPRELRDSKIRHQVMAPAMSLSLNRADSAYGGQLPYTLRPEVAAALNPPQSSIVQKDKVQQGDLPPVPSQESTGMIDMDSGEVDAGAYTSVARDQSTLQPAAPAMANPQGHLTTLDAVITRSAPTQLSTSTVHADIYPDVSVDDYLSGRFQPPSNRL